MVCNGTWVSSLGREAEKDDRLGPKEKVRPAALMEKVLESLCGGLPERRWW